MMELYVKLWSIIKEAEETGYSPFQIIGSLESVKSSFIMGLSKEGIKEMLKG